MEQPFDIGFDRKPDIAPGQYLGTVYRIVDLGTQTEEVDDDKTKKKKTVTRHKIRVSFELPDCPLVIDGITKPASINQEFTVSNDEKAKIRPYLDAMFGEGETPSVLKLLGRSCFVTVQHKTSKKGKEYAALSGAVKVPKFHPQTGESVAVPVPFNKPSAFLITGPESFKSQQYLDLPDFIRESIENSKEFKSAGTPKDEAFGE